MLINFYHTLSVKQDATQAHIDSMYEKLAEKYHPVKRPGPHAEHLFAAVTEAYYILNNPERRALYNELLDTYEFAMVRPASIDKDDLHLLKHWRETALKSSDDLRYLTTKASKQRHFGKLLSAAGLFFIGFVLSMGAFIVFEGLVSYGFFALGIAYFVISVWAYKNPKVPAYVGYGLAIAIAVAAYIMLQQPENTQVLSAMAP